MYLNTNYPHSDEEMKRYDEAEFRKYRGRKGVIEEHIHRLQVKPADYLLTVGLLPELTHAPRILRTALSAIPYYRSWEVGFSSDVLSPRCLYEYRFT